MFVEQSYRKGLARKMSESASTAKRYGVAFPNPPKDKTTNKLLEINRGIPAFIYQEIGITPSQAQLFFAPGNDRLTPELMDLIDDNNIDTLAGEVNYSDIKHSFSPPSEVSPDENAFEHVINKIQSFSLAIKALSINRSRKQADFHLRNLQALLEKGVNIVTTDAELQSIIGNGENIPLSALTIELAAGILFVSGVSTLASILADRQQNSLLDRRTILKALALGAGTAVLTTGGLAARLIYNREHVAVGRDKTAEKLVRQEVAFEELKEQVGLEKNPYLTYTKRAVDLRNLIWLLNGLNALATSVTTTQEKPRRMLMFFGTGHGETFDLLNEGVTALEARVEDYAGRLCTTTIDYLLSAYGRDNQSEQQIYDKTLQQLANHADMFTEPLWFGEHTYNQNLVAKRIPRTAKSILIDVINSTISQLEKDTTPHSQKKIQILTELLVNISQTLTKRVMEGNKFMQRTANTDGPVLIENNGLVNISDTTHAESKVKDLPEINKGEYRKIFFNQVVESGQDLWVPAGMCRSHGRTIPVIKKLTLTPDHADIQDLGLYSRSRLALSRADFDRVNITTGQSFAEPKFIITLSRHPQRDTEDRIALVAQNFLPFADILSLPNVYQQSNLTGQSTFNIDYLVEFII